MCSFSYYFSNFLKRAKAPSDIILRGSVPWKPQHWVTAHGHTTEHMSHVKCHLHQFLICIPVYPLVCEKEKKSAWENAAFWNTENIQIYLPSTFHVWAIEAVACMYVCMYNSIFLTVRLLHGSRVTFTVTIDLLEKIKSLHTVFGQEMRLGLLIINTKCISLRARYNFWMCWDRNYFGWCSYWFPVTH